jgi:hypothetical protein
MPRRDSLPVYPLISYKGRYARVKWNRKEYLFKDHGTDESRELFDTWRDMLREKLESGVADVCPPTVAEAVKEHTSRTKEIDRVQAREELKRELRLDKPELITVAVPPAPPAQVITPAPTVIRVSEKTNWFQTTVVGVVSALLAGLLVVSVFSANASAGLTKKVIDEDRGADTSSGAGKSTKVAPRQEMFDAFIRRQKENFSATAALSPAERDRRTKALMDGYHQRKPQDVAGEGVSGS